VKKWTEDSVGVKKLVTVPKTSKHTNTIKQTGRN
jgi:hypothetical protein